MLVRSLLAGLLACSLALAEPATLPTTRPATQPGGGPTGSRYPRLDELVALQKAREAELAARRQVAMFEINSAVTERPSDFSWFGPSDALTLRSIVSRLHKARDDQSLQAVLLSFGAGASMNLAAATEIRDALAEIRRAGKKVFVFADSYDSITYTVASAATDICMLEAGEVTIPGIGVETMFYRGTMDKVGITPDFVQIGEYKGAQEPYMRTSASEELRGEMNKLVDSLFTLIVDGIATTRGLSRDTVRRAIDDTMVSGPEALERGLVDHLVDQDGLRQLIERKLDGEMNLIENYAAKPREEVDFSNIFSLLKAMTRKPEATRGPTVALFYAEGVITDGSGEGGLLESAGIGSETMRSALRTAGKDENVKAVVIRIDSPGGSALASEVIWQAIRRVAKEKPVIISIGGMAASGGYYLASAGDYIFADPSAIIGSIGVVGGKFVLKDLFTRIGLSTEEFSKGRNADLYSTTKVWDERQRELIRKSMQTVYDQFTQRVMTTRRGKIADIDRVARGRIFLAGEAQKLGLVDELGGLEKAIAHAAERAGLEKDKFEIQTLPAPKTLADLLSGGTTQLRSASRSVLSSDSLLLAVPESARRQLARQLLLMRVLEKRGVALLAPFMLQIR
ncbi:MAG: signal peptide peptidase SppA [Phycisphaerae bacterium]|nr:signal peptide peptidase SppA [Phycisphaerae bacterium]MDW8263121.1 signal peptide peptidase SppA [Phycisphaerales bacterium]